MDVDRVNNYELLRQIARGGMGVVFLAHQSALGRDVALKRLDLDSSDPTLAERFMREARLAAGLEHPNIVTLLDFFEHDGVPYIAMEYVAGGPLRAHIGSLELPQVFGVLEGVLAGLEHAESHGIAHRDLKPENLLLTRGGVVKIADFGIARAYNALTQRLTRTGMAMGTPAYMAPEQALNEPLGPYSDIYSLGVIGYEMLAGRPPFPGTDTPVVVLYNHVHTPPPSLAEAAPGVPTRACRWVEWLLAKAPADRPASAREAREALEDLAVDELGPLWRRAAPIASASAERREGFATYGRPPAPDTPRTAQPPATSDPPPTPPPPAAPPPAAPPPVASTPAESPAPPSEPEPAPAVTPVTPVTEAAASERGRRWMIPLVLGLVAAGAAVVALVVVLGGDGDGDGDGGGGGGGGGGGNRETARPFDFNGDDHADLTFSFVTGSAVDGPAGTGVVVVNGDPSRDEPLRLVTPEDVDAVPEGREDGFGASISSADFNADGLADLVVATPALEQLAVLYGDSNEVLGGRLQTLAASSLPLESGEADLGALAGDTNGDGFDDLVVAAAGQPGSVVILPGGSGGLDPEGAWAVRPPEDVAGFGSRIRLADVDADGLTDLVEGGPIDTGGHLSFCRGTSRGPRRCREVEAAGGTTSLAAADVNDDGHADIAQGDSQSGVGGEVRVWLGADDGLTQAPEIVSQASDGIPGDDFAGDRFGAVVEAADLDDDGFADIAVAAPGEREEEGRVTLIPGGPDGIATGARWIDQDTPGVPGTPAPGHVFGSTLGLFDATGDALPDLAVAAVGEELDTRVIVVEGAGDLFEEPRVRARAARGLDGVVDAPVGTRMRIGRP